MGVLPAPARRRTAAARGRGTGPAGDWPPLPAADFPTFLAACRRYLPRAEFAQVARLYYDTAEAADAWLDTYGAPRDPRDGQLTPGFEAATAGWLRDSAIGPAPCGPAALVRLRAVQAALFVRAIVLSWRPGPLGPQPATRLPGNLTSQVAGALQTAVRTDAAAATALSAHLNQGPAFFGLLQLSDVAPDGSAIRVPPGRARPRRAHHAGSGRPVRPGTPGRRAELARARRRRAHPHPRLCAAPVRRAPGLPPRKRRRQHRPLLRAPPRPGKQARYRRLARGDPRHRAADRPGPALAAR